MALTQVSRGLLSTSIDDNGNATAITIDSSENVGIGTASPTGNLEIATSASDAGVDLVLDGNKTSNGGIGSIIFNNNGDSVGMIRSNRASANDAADMLFYTQATGGANTERMRLHANGKITASSSIASDFISYFQQTNSSGFLFGLDTASSALVYFYKSGSTFVGSISTNGSSVSYNETSDERAKEKIQDANDAGAIIDAIQVRQFDWRADGRHQDYGTVAQELISVFPDAVSIGEDPEQMMGVDYSKLVPMLVKEIQSLRARVAQLENN